MTTRERRTRGCKSGVKLPLSAAHPPASALPPTVLPPSSELLPLPASVVPPAALPPASELPPPVEMLPLPVSVAMLAVLPLAVAMLAVVPRLVGNLRKYVVGEMATVWVENRVFDVWTPMTFVEIFPGTCVVSAEISPGALVEIFVEISPGALVEIVAWVLVFVCSYR